MTPPPSFAQLVATFGRIGLINFGGPAGQIALMHRVVVDEKGWIEEDAYLRALNVCTLLPGPEAQQLATYVGWRLHGVKGGLAAGLLFIAPGAVVILGLSILYALAADVGPVAAAFFGIKAAVLAVVAEALIRLGRRALKSRLALAVAVLAFAALFVFRAPFPLVIALAALVGALAVRGTDAEQPPPAQSWRAPLTASGRAAGTWLLIWAAPLALSLAVLGPDHVITTLGLFFSKLAVVTFGGAYAVLAYVAQEAVATHGWLKPGEMVDGLGLAETTPGPLILVNGFVGFLAAFRAPEPFAPLLAGVIGFAMTLWATFAPCFLWIFAGAPLIERLEHARRLQGALTMITAAVVGVIANLTVWFALHVLFARVEDRRFGPAHLNLPDPASFNLAAAGLAALAAALLFGLRLGVVKTLAVCVAGGLGLWALGLV